MKKLMILIVLAGFAAAVIAYLTREQMLPAPEASHEPLPNLRTGSAPSDSTVAEDLTEVKGIGPTYASRLADISISTRSALASADPHVVAEAVGTSPATVKAWQADVTR